MTHPAMLYAGDLLRKPPRVEWAPADVLAAPVAAAAIAVPILATGMALGHLLFSGKAAAGSPGHLLVVMAGLSVMYGSLFAGTALFTVGKYRLPWQVLRFQRVRRRAYVAMLPLLAAVYLASSVLGWALGPLASADLTTPQVDGLVSSFSVSWSGLLGALLIVGVLAPIVEETYFRGMVYGLLRERYGTGRAVLVSAAIFAGAHVFVFGHYMVVAFPELFILGAILAMVVERTRSLYPAILLHALNNGVVVVALFWSITAGTALAS
jgi:membrane protease YdiL (CAAX protease family)